MSFKTFIIERWDKLPFRDKSMNMMAALKAASIIKEGSNITVDELLTDTEQILEHFYEFDWNQKPAIDKKAVADEIDKIETTTDPKTNIITLKKGESPKKKPF